MLLRKGREREERGSERNQEESRVCDGIREGIAGRVEDNLTKKQNVGLQASRYVRGC